MDVGIFKNVEITHSITENQSAFSICVINLNSSANKENITREI